MLRVFVIILRAKYGGNIREKLFSARGTGYFSPGKMHIFQGKTRRFVCDSSLWMPIVSINIFRESVFQTLALVMALQGLFDHQSLQERQAAFGARPAPSFQIEK